LIQENIQGVIAVLLTPFDENEKLKITALEELVEFLLNKGVYGLFPCGSYSLGPLMSSAERKKILEVVVKTNQNRVPVLAQVGAVDTKTTIGLALHAQKVGVDGVVSIPPFYIPVNEDAIFNHFKALKKAVDTPVYIYNNLWTGKIISPELLSRLIEIGYQGMKDAGEDFILHCQYLRESPTSFNLLMGTEKLAFPALSMGTKGFTSGTVNAFPEINVALYRLFQEGKLDQAAKLQQKILQLIEILSMGPEISTMYTCVNLRGLSIGQPKLPLQPISPVLQEKIKNRLRDLGMLEEPYF